MVCAHVLKIFVKLANVLWYVRHRHNYIMIQCMQDIKLEKE